MSRSIAKNFESVIYKAFSKVPGVSIDRIHDQTTHFKGSTNICDFIIYREPYEYYIECKTVHGNTLSIHSIPKPDKKGALHGFYGNITDKQWEGMLEKSKIQGVFAGVICWWVSKDVTMFIPIQRLQICKEEKWKSINYVKALTISDCIELHGKKKRVFFDYDVEELLDEISSCNR